MERGDIDVEMSILERCQRYRSTARGSQELRRGKSRLASVHKHEAGKMTIMLRRFGWEHSEYLQCRGRAVEERKSGIADRGNLAAAGTKHKESAPARPRPWATARRSGRATMRHRSPWTAFLVLCILLSTSRIAFGFSMPSWGLASKQALNHHAVDVASGKPQPCALTADPRSSFLYAKHPTTILFLYAPPGSGYAGREDEVSALPTTYEPMMEYPGTMRPGRTPENMPFHDLPIGDDDPDPVPWPHLQQISWHHQWEPPHEHPVPIEDFIEMQGRWATPELEAEMRAGARQSFRERRELQESEKRQMVITDDDDDDDGADADDAVELLNVALGEGVFGKLGSDADRAATAIATSPREGGAATEDDDDGGDQIRLGGAVGDSENLEDDGLDFLLDLGLDMLEEDDEDGGVVPSVTASTLQVSRSGVSPLSPPAKVDDDDDIDFDDEDVTVSSAISVEVDDEDDDDAIDFGVDDDDDVAGVGDDEDEMDDSAGSGSGLDEVSLDDYGDNDGLDNDIFDEGGFDYDDYENDNDGGDMW